MVPPMVAPSTVGSRLPRACPVVVLGGFAVSYERGTPVQRLRERERDLEDGVISRGDKDGATIAASLSHRERAKVRV